MVTHFRQLFAFEFEMTEKVISAIERAGNCDQAQQAQRQAAHIVAARSCWLERIDTGTSAHVNLWPEPDFHRLREMDLVTQLRLQIILSNMDEAYLKRKLKYRSYEGEACERSMADILMHIVLHSSYHRGYINCFLKACGKPPVNSDYIVWAE